MPNFILGGIRNGMGVSTRNSIADLQSARPTRFRRASPNILYPSGRCVAECNSAMRQIANLRYEASGRTLTR